MAISPKKKVAGGGGQNIQVFVRCRPLNTSEKEARSYSVVDCPNSREVTVKEKSTSSVTKTFQFDKVFGHQSKQIEVYRSVVEPLLLQVLQGYNCTVFAYGQTGTGKTFTMEGGDGRDEPGVTWENDPTAGIIPRALAQLFDELRVQQDAEFTVRVSFLELYNEEIFDLLSAADDTTRLKLFEDSTKKGSVIVQGLEEALVQNKAEVYKILERGSAKRKTAATMMNAHSSRSHTVFTVTVHMKESNPEGEEVLRIGKLNLVDLAGSENIGRSGAQEKRATEAGNINKSLLTLGRVITCLVDRKSSHVPYRESKLTRLLQDSLGGRTKTSIIATISPAGCNLDETLSTLDYAHRAKNIRNQPEVNQKMSKSAKLKEYTEEIEKLRKDLIAAREKNGIFIANDRYQDMLSQIEMGNQEMAEKIATMKALNEEKAKLETLFEEVSEELKEKEVELNCVSDKLQETEETLEATKVVLRKTTSEKEEQTYLVDRHVETESKLKEQAKRLMETADMSSKDLKHLHDKLDRLKNVDVSNSLSKEEFSKTFGLAVEDILDNLDTYGSGHENDCGNVVKMLGKQLDKRTGKLEDVKSTVDTLLSDQNNALGEFDVLRQQIGAAEADYISSQQQGIKTSLESQKALLASFKSSKVNPLLKQCSEVLDTQVKELVQLKATIAEELSKLVSSVNSFSVVVVDNITELRKAVDMYATSNDDRIKSLQQRNQEIRTSEDNFKQLLESLMKSYHDHSSLVTKNMETMDAMAMEDLKEAEALVDKSKAVNATVEKSQEETLTSFDQNQASIVNMITESSDTCGQLNSQVGQLSKEMETMVQEHVTNSISALEKVAKDNMELVAGHTKKQEQQVQQFKDALEENKTNLNIVGQAIVEKLHDIQTKDNEGVEMVEDTIAEITANTKDIIVGIQSKLTEEHDNVKKFLTETLQQDVPSGLTPARVERSFPRYLAATSPHEKLISRFRAQAELAAAAKLALDESDDGDSAFSANTSGQSGKISRQNSTGDVRRITPENSVQRSNSTDSRRTPSVSRDNRTPSTSRPGSRSSSRQNSSTDLSKKFGSTSDIGSEIGDLENQDPNFRKPKAVNKREIKKPEIRNPSATRSRIPSATN